MDDVNVPEIVVRRLPLYARALQWLEMDGVPDHLLGRAGRPAWA